jgi:hypothetical protein
MKDTKQVNEISKLSGARDRNRTSDTRIFNPLLYQLSYPGSMLFGGLSSAGAWFSPGASGVITPNFLGATPVTVFFQFFVSALKNWAFQPSSLRGRR